MTTTTTARKSDRFARAYDMIVTRRRRLLGMGGLDQIHVIGLWQDVNGRKRRTELYPEGTATHRRYHDWHRRLRATEWCMVRAEARYRRLIAELAGNVPVYDPELVAAE